MSTNRIANRLPRAITRGQRIYLTKLDLAYSRAMLRVLRESNATPEEKQPLIDMSGAARKALLELKVPAVEWSRFGPE